ncbi:hypothetical protein [Mycolicibacterium thermoresistibile]
MVTVERVRRSTVAPGRRRLYVIVAIALALWAATIVVLAAAVVNLDLYWFSYYAADYSYGFVRRGLGGELIGLFPDGAYFTVAAVLRWSSTAAFLLGLTALAWRVLTRRPRSDRTLLLALLIPVLPFGVAFAFYSARPDLFGAAALALFAVAITMLASDRARMAAGAVFGAAIALLAFVHEAIALEFALGAILTVLVLGRSSPRTGRRVIMMLAVGPGLLAAALISLLGRHDVGAQLCAQVPHRPVDDLTTKLTVSDFVDYVVRGQRRHVDYHDWVCANITPIFDYSVGDAIRVVAGIGPVLLLASLVFGAGIVVATQWCIGYVSGVGFGAFWNHLRSAPLWPALGLALIVPVFVTGHDWVRWCVLIAFNIAVPYLLYTLDRPEPDVRPTTRQVRITVLIFAAWAVLPLGVVPGFGDLQT